MFRLFDALVLVTSLSTFGLCIYVYITNGVSDALFIGVFGIFILALSIYVKLLRIVHFVLYKTLNQYEKKDGETYG